MLIRSWQISFVRVTGSDRNLRDSHHSDFLFEVNIARYTATGCQSNEKSRKKTKKSFRSPSRDSVHSKKEGLHK